jgi:hypothetical protein
MQCVGLVTPLCQQAKLYPGERIEELAGYPALVRFVKGDPQKPLLVFIPGSQHLARISYGTPYTRPEDFLGYWLHALGYNFLAISYPVVTVHPVFDKEYPDFTARVWGQQIALAAKQAIRENGLINTVYFLHWSMAGRVVEPAAVAAKQLDLNLEAAISLAASPPIPKEVPVPMPMTFAGIVHKDDNYADWLKQLSSNTADNDGRIIIPPNVYTAEFVGDMTVNLQGNGEVYSGGKFIVNTNAQLRDYGSFVLSGYPLVVSLLDDKASDPVHALSDQTNWAFFNGRTASRIGSPMALRLAPEKWDALVTLSRNMNERLSIPVGGNHFFFVGEKGARATATAIDQAIDAVQLFKRDWTVITGKPFE